MYRAERRNRCRDNHGRGWGWVWKSGRYTVGGVTLGSSAHRHVHVVRRMPGKKYPYSGEKRRAKG